MISVSRVTENHRWLLSSTPKVSTPTERIRSNDSLWAGKVLYYRECSTYDYSFLDTSAYLKRFTSSKISQPSFWNSTTLASELNGGSFGDPCTIRDSSVEDAGEKPHSWIDEKNYRHARSCMMLLSLRPRQLGWHCSWYVTNIYQKISKCTSASEDGVTMREEYEALKLHTDRQQW